MERNKRIELMTSSASILVLQSGACGALLVTAHPDRYTQLTPSTTPLFVN